MFFDERPRRGSTTPFSLREHGQALAKQVHYWAHQPHTPPPPFSDLFAQNLYQGEIAYVDQARRRHGGARRWTSPRQ
jgi:hypothetical protein